VIKVYGSSGEETLKLEATEATEADTDRKSPYGAGVTSKAKTSKAKSEANGVRAMDAPVSTTRPKFGWRVGTESEAGVVGIGAKATTVDAGSTVAVETAEAANGEVGSTPISIKSCVYR